MFNTLSPNSPTTNLTKKGVVVSLLLLSHILAAPLLGFAENPVDTLQPGHWYEVPNSHLRDVAPNPLPPGGPLENIMRAWSGGAYDTTRDRFIVWGGGHADYSGNEIYVFDINLLRWERLTNPSLDVGGDPASGVYPDGLPRSRHTYNYIEYVPSIDRFCSFGGSAMYPSGNDNTPRIDCFNFDTRQWEHRGSIPAAGNPIESIAVYDDLTGHIYYKGSFNSRLGEYDPVNNTWTESSNEFYLNQQRNGAIDSDRQLFLILGNGSQQIWDLGTGGPIQALSTSGTAPSSRSPGLVYDPVSKKFVAWEGGTSVYSLDMDTLTWTKHSPAITNTGNPGPQSQWGTFGRFRYIPSKNAFIVVNSVDENVFIYKLTDAQGTLPPAGQEPPPPSSDPGATSSTSFDTGTQSTSTGSCSAIQLGDVVIDPPTFLSLGFSIPILSGDTNYNAIVQVQYRKTGTTLWKDALPLLRVRPETLSTESRPPATHIVGEQFAGSIMNLQPNTSYNVRFNLTDPDGCAQTLELTTQTRKEPTAEPATPRHLSVNSIDALNSAIASAVPGDIITLSNGTHTANHAANDAVLIQAKQGTEDNPIIIRGESREGTIIDANAKEYAIRTDFSDYIYIEDLTIKNAKYGIKVFGDSTGIVIQRNIIREVTLGIDTKNYTKRNLTICDNDLRGGVVFPKIDDSTWNFEGIVLHGTGGVVCYNTVAGFGDALGFSFPNDTPQPHRGNDFYGNDVLWGGDDCFEFDYSERNNRTFRNRCSNTANGISGQPIFGGPAYAFQNIVYNLQRQSPIKPNNTPSGFLLYHNLFSLPWFSYASDAYNFDLRNNLFIAVPQSWVADVSTNLWGGSQAEPATIDYNGWAYSGEIRLGRASGSWLNFSDMQAAGIFEQHGTVLTSPIFENEVPLQPAYPNGKGLFLSPIEPVLHPSSNAIDAAQVLPNINDGYTGSGPDMGPYERGQSLPHYGVRPWKLNGGSSSADTIPPAPPLGLTVQ